MSRRSSNHFRTFLLPILLAASFSTSVIAQKMPKVEPFGIDGFRLMLQQQGLEATQTGVGTAFDTPTETVLVIIGDILPAMSMRGQVNKFLHEGGAALVATDAGGVNKRRIPWIPVSSLRATEFRFTRPFNARNRNQAYNGHSDCPIVDDFDEGPAPGLFDGVTSIISNRPGTLSLVDGTRCIARLPPSRTSKEPEPLLAVYNHPSGGRLLLAADHSLFINEMLIHGDNARFAKNVTSWLAEGGRSRLVVIYNGSVLPQWSFGENPPAIPLNSLLQAVTEHGLAGLPIIEAGTMLNQSLSQFERQNGFNNLIHQVGRGIFGRKPIRIVLILFTTALLFFATRWLMFTRGRAQRWLFYQDSEPEPETRLTSAVNEKQYQPYLRMLTREFFADSGVTHFGEPENPPSVTIQKTFGKSKIAKEVTAFWDIATKTDSEKLSKRRFRTFVERLRELHHLQTNGVLKLE